MSSLRVDGRSAIERVEDLPRIERALRRAVQEALAHHKRVGNPIVIWRNGAVAWVPPEEIVLENVDEGE